MADDLPSYKLQLQQVEAALLTDPENSELLKLKKDLEEVIELTRDLIRTQLEEQKKSSYVEPIVSHSSIAGPAGSSSGSSVSTIKSSSAGSSTLAAAAAASSATSTASGSKSYYDEIEAALQAAERLVQSKQWKIGDKCQAKWTEDGVYYDAVIEGITETGEVSVVFEAYQNRCTLTIKDLKERVIRNEVFPSVKRHRVNNKEYLKKKKQRKLQRFKELEEEREHDKNKWISFTSKTNKKVGTTKLKSIFASPENVNGRVGIGTCGVSGRPMTEYSYGEKYRKGA